MDWSFTALSRWFGQTALYRPERVAIIFRFTAVRSLPARPRRAQFDSLSTTFGSLSETGSRFDYPRTSGLRSRIRIWTDSLTHSGNYQFRNPFLSRRSPDRNERR